MGQGAGEEMIQAYPKIFTIGTNYIRDIFKDPVEITEKIDGSQFAFGRVKGEVFIRSKGAMLYFENHQKMFSEAISYIDQIRDRIPDGYVFYAEYLQKPKHNTLKYDRIPKNHLMLFGVMTIGQKMILDTSKYADLFEIENVPVIDFVKVENIADLNALLDRESALGGCKVEGIVAKNFNRPFLLGGQPIPIMAGKFVSEGFKEVHRDRWGAEEKTKGRLEIFMESFRTEARWEKAVQHLSERGELENEPRDMGKLFKEVQSDIEAEETENIKNFLLSEFIGQIKRKATAGMPEWYKNRLAERSF